ncbi:MAG: iron chelate uptake ABC transporter family permease subunit [Spirochaetaceae bacterium]|jgi:iron complex transport system permease protein|nr:iron chelate uptake ABC transporter family permease subunit [Spirochaetaceae bacterium]
MENKTTIALAVTLLLLSVGSLFIGVVPLDIFGLMGGNFKQTEILLLSRFPRLLAILCTGAGMSTAGLIMQQLCFNKFVSPSTGATIASAQFGILLAMLVFPSSTLLHKAAFSFASAIAGTWIFIFFVQRIKFKDVIMVPLVGIMFGNIIGGVTEYLSYRYGLMQALSSWLVGDFSLIIQGRYEMVFLCLPMIILAFIYANHFNIVGLGEHFSKNLGVNYSMILFFGLSIAAVITASVVVIVGAIPYIGLIIPNIVSMFKGDNIRGTLADTAITGALFVLVCDIIGRLVIFPYEIPVNLIIGVAGSVIFIGLLFRRLSTGNKSPVKIPGKNSGQGRQPE